MKKFKSLITEFGQESGVVDYFGGSFIGEYPVRIGIEDVEFSSEKWLDSREFLGKEVTIIIGDSESEVPKRELPVIPKYVSDWVIRHRDTYDLYPALRTLENNTLVWGEIYEWYRMNTHKFVNVYLTGEYEVEEEPLYYALIKGHELIDTDRFYWIYEKYEESVFVSKLYSLYGNLLTEMSKSQWNELGINDSNADFVKVEE